MLSSDEETNRAASERSAGFSFVRPLHYPSTFRVKRRNSPADGSAAVSCGRHCRWHRDGVRDRRTRIRPDNGRTRIRLNTDKYGSTRISEMFGSVTVPVSVRVFERSSEREGPGLGHEAFPAEAVVGFFPGQPESRPLVQTPRSLEFALRPQHDLPVSGLSCEAHALVDQAGTDAMTARRRFDEQQSKPCHRVRFADQEDGADD